MKKIISIISLFLCMLLVFSACGKSSKSEEADIDSDYEEENEEESEKESEEESEEEAEEEAEGEFQIEFNMEAEESFSDADDVKELNASNLDCPTDFKDYWEMMYNLNEDAYTGWNDIPTYATDPVFCLLTAFQYDMLNTGNSDGRHEGELILNGNMGFIEKNGSQYTFGYDDIRDADGFGPSSKKGDRLFETGYYDASAGTYFVDSYDERDGMKIDRTTSTYQVEEDGSISCYIIEASIFDARGDEKPSNVFIFIRNGDGRYEYVIAEGAIGTEYEMFTLEEDMTNEKARKVFEDAGYEITDIGSIQGSSITNERFKDDWF